MKERFGAGGESNCLKNSTGYYGSSKLRNFIKIMNTLKYISDT